MKALAHSLRPTITYCHADLVAVALLSLLVSLWAMVAGGGFSWPVFLACQVLFFAFYLTGSLVAGYRQLARGVCFDLPLRLLVGYALLNTAALVLAWTSPLGVLANFAGLVLLVAVVAFWGSFKRVGGNAATFWAIGICALATTLWCQDSIDPIQDKGRYVLFKPWIDGFYHAVHIRIFADSHGAATIEDFRMVGVPARLYHYGVYMLPAFVKAASGISSYSAFAGILAPVGVLFSGFAAYALFATWWGAWPGVMAAAALLLLPDGAGQGMQNTFMSFHWLTQISPSATYGLALLGVAWLFVLRGCLAKSPVQLVFGWCVAGVIVAYKLHYVVASALLFLVVPALFFGVRKSVAKRALLLVASVGLYATALAIGQQVPGVPLIRFDGSSTGEILTLVQSFLRPGPFKEFLSQHMGRGFSWTSNLLYGIPYVLFSVFGVSLLGFTILVALLRKRLAPLALVFPLLLIANFLLMFFGLALDFQSSTPDELNHRPLMIVYFFVMAWSGGALGVFLLKAPHLRSRVPAIAITLSAALMVVPAYQGRGVQLMWVMPKISPVRLPKPVMEVAEYIRSHGSPEDVFQDTQFDRVYAIAALSERRPFVAHTLTRMPFREEMVSTRTVAVNRIMAMKQAKLVSGTLQAYGVRWFVVPAGNRLNWPAELADSPVYRSGPLSLYEF